MNTETPERPRFLDRLQAFLTRYRTVLVVFLIVAAVAVVTLFIVLEIIDNRHENALMRVEEVQQSYGEWLVLGEEERETEFAAFEDEITTLLEEYSRGYARQRGLFIYAQALDDLERWEDSREQYAAIADSFPESYLAPISLTLAAIASENAGDPRGALELLTRLVDDYEADVSEIPRALFSIGRINETLDNVAPAAESYNRLIDEYPGSSWTNLARARIITLTVQGRIGS